MGTILFIPGILTYVNLFLICYHIPNYSAMGKLGVKIQNTKFKI